MSTLAMQDFKWSDVATDLAAERLAAEPGALPQLSRSSFPAAEPDVENQISVAEDPTAVTFFRQFHLPMIEAAGIAPEGSRILELGGGFGRLAYGTLQSLTPQYYLATDVFSQLVSILQRDLPKWTSAPTNAALLDPQDELLFAPRAFNVIQSHSVLHHVLNYREAVQAMFDRLDSPGVLIFCEPCLEGYLYFMTVCRLFARLEPFSPELRLQIDLLEQYIMQRTGSHRADKNYLSQFGTGDKYLYSAYDLINLSDMLGARLNVLNDTRTLKNNLKFELSLRGADAATLAKFDEFLTDLLPEGVENAYFSDLRQVFSFCKS